MQPLGSYLWLEIRPEVICDRSMAVARDRGGARPGRVVPYAAILRLKGAMGKLTVRASLCGGLPGYDMYTVVDVGTGRCLSAHRPNEKGV